MIFVSTGYGQWKYNGPPPSPKVEAFHRQLPDYNETPLVELPELAKTLGLGHVLIKDESHRFGLPAFKILGASWACYRAAAEKCKLPPTTSLEDLGAAARAQNLKFVTCTAGNWGRAVARMAKYLQVPATVFVPKLMDQATQDRISNEGAKVVVVQGDYDVSIQMARREAQEKSGLLIFDTSWKGYEEIPQWVVEGYSTMLAETDRQLEQLLGKPATHVIASVGVGSWAQAVAMYYKAKNTPVTVIAVEPNSAACLQTSLGAGKIVPIETEHTIMNGMNCGTVSYTAWEVLRKGIDVSVTVSDAEAHQALQYLNAQSIQSGPCGAAPLSALGQLVRAKERAGLNESSVIVLFSTEGARDYDVPS